MYENLSKEFIHRLPRYYRYLNEFLGKGVNYVSSQEIARKMGVTSSQIRNDMSKFAVTGQQGQGYDTRELVEEIAKVLGLDIPKDVILIGAGNIGKALITHRMFEENRFNLIGVFDIQELPDIGGQKIRKLSTLPDFVKEHKPDIAVIAVPSTAANATAQDIIRLGIRGILNFSYTDIEAPDDIVVQNIHIRIGLAVKNFFKLRY